MKTITQTPSSKAGLPAFLAISIIAALAAGLAGCASGRDNSAYRSHEMGPPKAKSRMSNQSMPNYPGR